MNNYNEVATAVHQLVSNLYKERLDNDEQSNYTEMKEAMFPLHCEWQAFNLAVRKKNIDEAVMIAMKMSAIFCKYAMDYLPKTKITDE